MTTKERAERDVKDAAEDAADSKALAIPARVGFAASGLLQVLLGGLAIQLGVVHRGEADQTGALSAVAKVPGGIVVLWIGVAGLFALAVWLIVKAVTVTGGSPRRRWMRRLTHIGKAIAYAFLGYAVFTFATGHPTHSRQTTSKTSAGILSLPAGQLLLGLLGLITCGVGLYFIWKGLRREFKKDIHVPPGAAGRGVVVAGAVGYPAKGLVVLLAGILFIVSAVRIQPGAATGLDGGLRMLQGLPFGGVVLVVLGVGLIISGIYNIARAWFAAE
jgi:hypothetical protein